MANLIKEDRYVKSDMDANNNKCWYIRLFSDFHIETEFGRIGNKTSISSKSFPSMEKAEKFYDSKCRSKEKGKKNEIPYRKLKVITETIKIDSSNLSMEEIVDEQIQTSSSDTKELLRYFIKQNIHNITENTAITYNKQTGLFETPCGPVTKEGIDEARVTLSNISKWINRSDRDERKFGMLVSEYLMIIPSKVGRKFDPTEVFNSVEDIECQEGILDSLEATYQTIMDTIANSNGNKLDAISKPRLFDVELDLITDEDIVSHIKKLYSDTKSSMHVCHRMKVKRVFSVKIGCMSEQFEKYGKPIGNIRELWHGTRDGNILSILKNGLIIPKDSDKHRCADMFGRGCYFSDQSTKSLNYSINFWQSAKNISNIGFMFLADVAMGNSYFPKTSDYQLHSKILRDNAFDSTYVKGGTAGVKNNEMIVYKTHQVNLKYLVEFA